MIARRFTSVVWVAAIGGAALTCYILSSKVAEERTGLAQLDAQIRKAERSIQTLKTEIGTRGRVSQLNHWASADFGFAAPTAEQFVEDEVRLASLQAPAVTPAVEQPVRMAQAPAATAEMPRAVQASAPREAPRQAAVRQASVREAGPERRAEQPMLRRAAVTETATPRGTARGVARPPRDAVAAPARRTAALVDEATIRDLDSRARTERSAERTPRRSR